MSGTTASPLYPNQIELRPGDANSWEVYARDSIQFSALAGPPELRLLACFLAQVPFFCLLAWVAQVEGGSGLLFFACLLELVAQV